MEERNESPFSAFDLEVLKAKKNENSFGWKELGAILAGFFVGQICIAFLVVIYMYILREDYNHSMGFMLLAYLCSLIFPIFAYEFLILKPKNKRLRFNFSTKPISIYLIIFPLMFGMMLVSEFFVSLIPTTGSFFGPMYQNFMSQMNFISDDYAGMMIMTVIFAPLLEEIFFRGIVLKGFINKGIKPWKAILFSSLIFGAVHGYPWQFLGATLLGLVLGLVYYKTQSLLMTILLHAFNNFSSCLLLMYGKTESFNELFSISRLLVLAIGVVLVGVFYYLLVFKNKETSTNSL